MSVANTKKFKEKMEEKMEEYQDRLDKEYEKKLIYSQEKYKESLNILLVDLAKEYNDKFKELEDRFEKFEYLNELLKMEKKGKLPWSKEDYEKKIKSMEKDIKKYEEIRNHLWEIESILNN